MDHKLDKTMKSYADNDYNIDNRNKLNTDKDGTNDPNWKTI